MKMPQLPDFFITSFWIVLASITGIVLFLWLFIIGGSKYSIHDTEAHAEHYGNIVKEGLGGMTRFLWVSFIAVLVWTIFYFIINSQQFLIILAQGYQ